MSNANKEVKFAFAYIRVSTEDQTEYSPDAQKAAILKYAAENGYIIQEQDFYVDAGISGRSAEKRPAFMEMIARAKGKDHPCDAILVHKFDRFARSREDSIVYKSLLKKECGVRVISITESIEDDKFSIILEAMLEAMAEYYSINLSEEVKKGMTEKHLRGENQTTPPFGYCIQGGILAPEQTEAKIIQDIFFKFTSGIGCFPIAKWLNESGIRTHRGNLFENRTVEYILRNPVYIGKLRWNPSGKTRRNFKDQNLVIVDGKHQAIIDKEVWEKAQEILDLQKERRKYHGRPVTAMADWLSGIVSCAACGNSLIFSRPHYWKCNGYAKGSCTHSQHIRDDLLKEAIIKQLKEDFESKYYLNYNTVKIRSNEKNELELLESSLEKITKKIARLRDAFLSGVESIEEYKETKSILEREKDEVTSKIEKLKNIGDEESNQEAMRASIGKVLKTLQSKDATDEERHNSLKSIVDKCVFDKSKNQLAMLYRLEL